MQEMAVRWKLKELLEREGVSAYALAQQMGGATRRPAVYAITSPDLGKRPDNSGLKLVDEIVTALEKLTGKPFKFDDVLERTPDPAPPAPTPPAEAEAGA